jgi:hypothetical protein
VSDDRGFSPVSDFITLSCSSCGGNLAVTNDAERFACPYCKREHLVRRAGGHVSLVPMIEKLARITEGVDRHASELAIQRLRGDRRALKERIRDQEDWINDGNQALAKATAELAGKRTRSVVALVIAALTGCLTIALLIAGSAVSVCFGVFCVGTAVAGAFSRMGLRERAARVKDIRRKLNEEYRHLDELRDKVDRIDAELEHHTRVVSL